MDRKQHRTFVSRLGFPMLVLGIYAFMYIPIVVLVLFSFNDSESSYQWTSFTTRWYQEVFASAEIWDSLLNSLIVACTSVVLSLVLGIWLVFYSAATKAQNLYLLFYGNLAVPEIVLAVAILSFFSLCSIPMGITTLIAGHTLLGLGYVVPIVQASFVELNDRFSEASQDLGATQTQTLRKIILPLLRPALFAAGLLVFIISLDDFVISFFCSGSSVQTLPIYIFSLIRTGASPVASALSTVLLGVSSILVLIFSSLHVRKIGVWR